MLNIEEIKARATHRQAFYHTLTAILRQDNDDIMFLLAEVERLTKENNSLAANGGKYMEIAQRRYEMVEEASKRAEDYEIDNAAKDQRIATLNKALEIAGKTLEKNFPPTKAQNWIDMWEQQAQEQEANHG